MADFILNNVRLSFPTLGEPQEFKQGDGKPRWDATFLIEPGSENDKKIRAGIQADAIAAFPGEQQKAAMFVKGVAGNGNKMCYLNGDTKEYDGYAGMWFLACHRSAKLKNGQKNNPPLLLDLDKSRLAADSGRIYAGCYVNAKVSIYVQPKGENPGIRCSFSVIQYNKAGKAFGAGAPSDAGFEALGAEEGGLEDAWGEEDKKPAVASDFDFGDDGFNMGDDAEVGFAF